MIRHPSESIKPEILDLAGNRQSFLAAVAAGADAVYCGLKAFSARMAAKNFAVEELCRLTRLAHETDTRVYVALNSLVTSGELNRMAAVLEDLHRRVQPDGLIVQDLAVLNLVGQLNIDIDIHLSTLANVSFPEALAWISDGLKISRIVLPRELSIDEIKSMARHCPSDMSLEVFVHGALCYAVSGRCYWSSMLGGKSGLRGRCVQPCRRRYLQRGQNRRMFSCQDLELDVLVKTLLPIPQITAWKIEGRKKSAHYVYHTVTAYRMLRDLDDHVDQKSEMKKAALALLEQALGRKGTHYRFLPQRPQNPVDTERPSGSGMMIGKVKGAGPRRFVTPRLALLPGDTLRIGYEDDAWHQRISIRRSIPARGRHYLKVSAFKPPPPDTPVFLVDRQDRALQEQIADLQRQAEKVNCPGICRIAPHLQLPRRIQPSTRTLEMRVYRKPPPKRHQTPYGRWLPEFLERLPPSGRDAKVWWWLSPALWPDTSKHQAQLIDMAIKRGAAGFVLNAPWQMALFAAKRKVPIWAGPFCNLSNPLSIAALARLGFAGVVVSPELGHHDLLQIPASSPIPMGIVITGYWPFCIARQTARQVKPNTVFTSPKGEKAWVVEHGGNYWMYPNWPLDLRSQRNALQQAGYRMLVHLVEPLPPGIEPKKRPGLWNWDVGLA